MWEGERRIRRMGVFYPDWSEGPSEITFELKPYRSLGKKTPGRGTCKYNNPGMEKHPASMIEHHKLGGQVMGGWVRDQEVVPCSLAGCG